MSNHFYTPEPSAYPDSWEVDGEGGEYCAECGCDFPREAASHAMYCSVAEDMREEIEAHDREHAVDYPYDTVAEQTGLDR